ncbi:hypothetical protein W97_05842 [Coniosporium apollinis CBS 100218]|uniref:BAR domain-containing protein n=1 Tax=Coniosporium apollinis (strain CBS 100218) TaxID=1168221 RepID=R7YY95_CONA1|nr:uncharacterized protein W97_05842 [Coniosporium apollinis CBS 100218]EON66596.1 hypothetical protein W97_05842 [Coniosporium apollinis CBS 100218]
MNVNKKLDRFKQWAGERMGGEVKTNTSEDFKMLETEMTLRHDGMEKLHKSMNMYIKSLSKRSEVEDREKTLPVAYLGSTMISHGEDFEPDSEFGMCLSAMGRANEKIGRMQESYVANATSSWLESLERSLAQMKEYQTSRKKLEQRRLAYDASLAKMQKSKKEDFRMEEELRSQKAKYEESSEDVFRRMQDIKEAEVESVTDLTAFVDAELAYYDKCRDVLVQLKRDWPAKSANGADSRDARRAPRSRSNTTYSDRFTSVENDHESVPKSTIPRLPSRSTTQRTDYFDSEPPAPALRPKMNRSITHDAPSPTRRRDISPPPMPRMSRVPTEPSILLANRSQLRPVRSRGNPNPATVFDDPSDDSALPDSSSPTERSYGRARSISPATSYGSGMSRNASWSTSETPASVGSAKKAPPPPPPSRAKKPPPPPVKRSALSSAEGAYD